MNVRSSTRASILCVLALPLLVLICAIGARAGTHSKKQTEIGTATGKAFDGTDCPGGVLGLYVPAIGTIGSTAEGAAEAGMYPSPGGGLISGGDDEHSDDDEWSDSAVTNRYLSDSYASTDAVTDMTDAGEFAAHGFAYGTIHPDWTDCGSLRSMLQDLRARADLVCKGACKLPATTTSSVIFVDGDFTVGPTESGAGMLIVTGTLSFDAAASWNGVLLVIGKGEFLRTGTSGTGVISGATIVGNIAGGDRIYGTSDDCTAASAGFDVPIYHEARRATGDTRYCTTDIMPALPLRSFKVVGFRQR